MCSLSCMGGSCRSFCLGAYWACAALFINMTLGGIIRIRKGVNQLGIIISHLGIVSLLLVGAIDHHKSIHGRMDVRQTGVNDYAWKFKSPSIEVFQYDADGNKERPLVVKHELLEDLDRSGMRRFKLPSMPFDIEVRGYIANAEVYDISRNKRRDGDGMVVDGLFLRPMKVDPSNDQYNYSCYVTIRPKNGEPSRTLLLSRQIAHPQTFAVAGKLYGIEMPNEIWKLPFEVKLLDSKGEYYPGTMRPSNFSSDIEWRDQSGVVHTRKIEMNKPLRYGGYTLYQANWNPPVNGVKYSGFEVVTNPAELGPKICLWVTTFGLFLHFMMKLVKFLERETRKAAKSE